METTFLSMMNRRWHLWIVTGGTPGGHCVDCEIWLHSGARSAGAEAIAVVPGEPHVDCEIWLHSGAHSAEAIAVAIKNYTIILSVLCPNLELGSSWIPSNTL